VNWYSPGDRVAYVLPGDGVVEATVLAYHRDGDVVVWPDRWGAIPKVHSATWAGEKLPPVALTPMKAGPDV
jgi:hypothetical protein